VAERVDEVEVNWPSGRKQILKNVPARQLIKIEEEAS